MSFSTKGRYALRLVLDIAENSNGDFVSLQEISGRQDFSQKYLQSIVPALVGGRILKSKKGKSGGYALARKPEEISVYDIISLAEGNISPVACLSEKDEPCEKACSCLARPVWTGLGDTMESYLKKISVKDILEKTIQEKKNERLF